MIFRGRPRNFITVIIGQIFYSLFGRDRDGACNCVNNRKKVRLSPDYLFYSYKSRDQEKKTTHPLFFLNVLQHLISRIFYTLTCTVPASLSVSFYITSMHQWNVPCPFILIYVLFYIPRCNSILCILLNFF